LEVIERCAAKPLVCLCIFRVRTALAANLVIFLVAASPFAMFYFNRDLTQGKGRTGLPILRY
jgi:hypothetical protein